MDAKENEFFEKLMITFREEAAEHIKALTDGLLELEKNLPPDAQQQVIESIFREAHSLKGAARSVNQRSILEICQVLESVLSKWKQNKIKVSSDSFDKLHAAITTIDNALTSTADPNEIAQVVEQLKILLEQDKPSFAEESLAEVAPLADLKDTYSNEKNSSKLEKQPALEKKSTELSENKIQKKEPEKKTLPTPPVTKKAQEKTIRVSTEKVNRFFQQAEETLIIKLLFKAQLDRVKQLQSSLYTQEKNLNRLFLDFEVFRLGLQEETANKKEYRSLKSIFKLLEKQLISLKSTREELNNLTKNAEQNVHVVGTTIDKLLEDLKKILMQPMSILFETLPHMIRDISRQLAKEINVEFQGGDIEVDRRVLEEIKDPVIHIIRNAIDHGIESPEERIQTGKTSFGTIRITASASEGNNVKLSIADDGHGIDVLKIKQASLKKGLISPKDLESMTDEQAIKLAFRSDISTSPIVTELSGRGLGLGIVSEKVDKLGGQTEVVSIPNQGTTFILTLPLTLATFRGVHISVAGQDFFLPTHNVKRVVRVKLNAIKKAENRDTIVLDERPYSFVHLANLLNLRKPETLSTPRDFLFVLLVKAAEETIAFGADDVYSEQEILVKGLGKQSVRVKNIMAATVIETGKVIPILNPTDLIKSSIDSGIKNTTTGLVKESQLSKKSILLVEDSITIRLLIKNILTSADYEVKTAVDGLEALGILQTEIFDLIVTDIEMPRMNGFELVEKIKATPKLQDIPIIICTALGASQDRKRGIDLGVNAYIDKSTFNLQSFVNIVEKLI